MVAARGVSLISERNLKGGHKDGVESIDPVTEIGEGEQQNAKKLSQVLRRKMWRTLEVGFSSIQGVAPQHRDHNNLSASDGSFEL